MALRLLAIKLFLIYKIAAYWLNAHQGAVMRQHFAKHISARRESSQCSRKLVWFASTAYAPSAVLTAFLPLQVALMSLVGIVPSWADECSITDITGCGAPGGLGIPGRSGDGGVGNGQGGGSSHIGGDGVTTQDPGGWGGNGTGGAGAQGDGGLPANGGGPGSIFLANGLVINGSGTGFDGAGGTSGTNFGGGGGGGGAGIRYSGQDISITSLGSISGGAGGQGGGVLNGTSGVGNGGGGGGGGSGITSVGPQARIANDGSIVGGIGGNGADGGFGGGGGAGGDGLLSLGGMANIINSGTIAGGVGGSGGASGGFGVKSTNGAGGTGINLSGQRNIIFNVGTVIGGEGNGGGTAIITRGQDTIYNAGTIAGALNNGTRSAAIEFGGAENRLNLYSGSTILGEIVINADATATILAVHQGLTLNSDVRLVDGTSSVTLNASFTDLELSGAISGNGIVNVRGGNVLTFSGASSYTGGTNISEGTLVANHVNDNGVIDALGTGLITLNGGRLHSALGRSTLNSYLVSAETTGTITTATGTSLWLNGGAGQSFSIEGDLVIGTDDARGDVIMDVIGTNTASASTITIAFGRLVDGNGSLGNLTGFAGATRVASGATLDFSAQGGTIRNLQDTTPGQGGTVSWGDNLLRVNGGSFSGQFVNSPIGELVKGSTDTLLLNGDNSGFTGTTTVAGGKLIVGDATHGSARLGSTIDVLSGATLGGYGSLGETTVQSGGILSPGNSIGTLTVDGDLTLKPGSVLEIEIASNGTSDRVDVAGTATVSGSNVSIATIDPETRYQNGQLYHILKADGGISGEFAGVVSNSAFLDMSLAYGDTTADLKICLKTGCPRPVDPEIPGPGTPEPEKPSPALFTTAAQTRNQYATAGGLDTLAQTGSPLALYNTLLMLSADGARAAFDNLSGEAYASAKGVLINDGQFIRSAAFGRLQQAFGGAPATPINALSYAGAQRHISASASAIDAVAPASIAPSQNLYTAWGYAYGAWTRQDENGNAGALKSTVGGFVTGIDGTVLDTWRLGLLAGYSHSSFDVEDRASSGSSDNYTLGAYAGTEWTLNNGHALAFRSGLAYSWHNVDMNRSVTFPGFADNLTGDYDAGSFQLFGELGYKIHYGKALFEPYAGLAYLRLKTDGFDEKGQTAAALSVQSGTTDTSFSTLGFRALTEFALGSIAATARTDLGWRHAYGDITPVSKASFIGSDSFTVSGLPIAEDAALIGAGLDFKLTEDATLGLSYNGQFASGAKQNGFNAKLSVSF
ncbi:autotransporter domain-containing protein [Ochrobactrum sp. 3-3]|uniref:autotransporter family protein n=1 Tax=Ochrobactrum sp. 3-3 TaxID=1830124 RepID=UPI0013B46F8D|nr:autotransporter domain-containing protein [Ochrobactrum sp. 3-3]